MTGSRSSRRTRFALLGLLGLTSVTSLGASPCYAQAPGRSASPSSATAPQRAEWQRLPDIMTALGATEGRRIADIGAGRGELTREIAARVGKSGRAYAVEISEDALRALGELAARDSLGNIEVVTGTETDPRLSADSIDGAVVLNTYHELTRHAEMLAAIRAALRPGGVLVLVDNSALNADEPRQAQVSRHGITPALVEAEVREAGFEIVERTDDFIVKPYPIWMLVARRPAR